MPKRKAPEEEMAVVWDGLAPIIGEPGSDDEVASSYDAFVQNDVGRESLRKMKNAHDGYFRRVRKRIRSQQPAASSASGGVVAAATASQGAAKVAEVGSEDARALINDRREGRGEIETEEEKKEREWQRDQLQRAMARQKRFENGDFSDFRHVEEPSASSSSSTSRVISASSSSSSATRVIAASSSAPRPRKAAIAARRSIAASTTNIKSLMNFRPQTPGITKNILARKLTRALPVEKSTPSLPPPAIRQ